MILLVILTLALCAYSAKIRITEGCETAFAAYAKRFDKVYTEDTYDVALDSFCFNYEAILKIIEEYRDDISGSMGFLTKIYQGLRNIASLHLPTNTDAMISRMDIGSLLSYLGLNFGENLDIERAENPLLTLTNSVEDEYSEDQVLLDQSEESQVEQNQSLRGSSSLRAGTPSASKSCFDEELWARLNPAGSGRESSFSIKYIDYDNYIKTHPLPSEVDLRKLGLVTVPRDQGAAGSCWSFGTATVLEGIMLRMLGSYRRSGDKEQTQAAFDNIPELLTLDTRSAAVSVDHILKHDYAGVYGRLSSTSGTGYYGDNGSNGGNFINAAISYATSDSNASKHLTAPNSCRMFDGSNVNGVSESPIDTLDLETFNPYFKESSNAQKIDRYYGVGGFAGRQASTQGYKLGLSKKWLPMDTKNFELHKINTNSNKWGAKEIYRVKSYLAAGIPIAAAMYTGCDSRFSYATSNVFDKECKSNSLNHQVAIVGYKKVNGVDAWIVKNSWGSSFGDKGFFYVKIGSNSFNIERYAYTFVPKSLPKEDYWAEGVPSWFMYDEAEKKHFSADILKQYGLDDIMQ